MDSFLAAVLKDYLDENWGSFSWFCEKRGLKEKDINEISECLEKFVNG